MHIKISRPESGPHPLSFVLSNLRGDCFYASGLKPNQNCGCPGACAAVGALGAVGFLVGLFGFFKSIGKVFMGLGVITASSLTTFCSSGE